VLVCVPSLGFVDFGRPSHGSIARNVISATGIPVTVDSAVLTSIRDNVIEGGFFGVSFGDSRAFFLPDDGPNNLGSVEQNQVSDALFGIAGVGPTTIGKAKISGSVSGARVGVLLIEGANGFLASHNEFPGGSSFADIVLDGAYPDFGIPPSHDNKVVVTDSATAVLDLGVDNKVIGK
jgi:hypothetical protein